MVVTIMRKNKIERIVLTKSSKNEYNISDNNIESKFNFERYCNSWQLKSNHKVKIIARF